MVTPCTAYRRGADPRYECTCKRCSYGPCEGCSDGYAQWKYTQRMELETKSLCDHCLEIHEDEYGPNLNTKPRKEWWEAESKKLVQCKGHLPSCKKMIDPNRTWIDEKGEGWPALDEYGDEGYCDDCIGYSIDSHSWALGQGHNAEGELEREYFTRFGDERGGKEWGEYTFTWFNNVGDWKPIEEDTKGWDDWDYADFREQKEYELVNDMLSDSDSELYGWIENHEYGHQKELYTSYEVLNEDGEKEVLGLLISWEEPEIESQKIQYYKKEPLHRLEFLAESFEMEGMLGNWEGKKENEPVSCPNCKWDGLESDLHYANQSYYCPECKRKDWEYIEFNAESFEAEEPYDEPASCGNCDWYGMSSELVWGKNPRIIKKTGKSYSKPQCPKCSYSSWFWSNEEPAWLQAESKKLPPVEKAIDTGIASGATMEGLDLALAAEEPPDKDDSLESWMEDFDAETERWIRILHSRGDDGFWEGSPPPFYGKGYGKKTHIPQ